MTKSVPVLIDELEAAILNSSEPAAHEYNVQTLADLVRRLHGFAALYRDLADLDNGTPFR